MGVSLRANDDMEFFDALLAHLSGRYRIDSDRVYLTGMSMGAIFANLLASQRSEKIAALASHSGWLGPLAHGIRAPRKYPVLIIHGDEDRIVPVQLARRMRDTYRSEGHKVEYLKVAGLGHRWSHPADVNTKIWEFFQRHPLK